MNLSAISAHLSDRRKVSLAVAVVNLEAGIEAKLVPNTLYTSAKDTINRAANEATEAFLNTGPHNAGHHQSDWWLGAYRANAFVSGATNIASALKRVVKIEGLKEYTTLLTSMLPLADLLKAAKPFIKKKGEIPRVKTEAELERESRTMTCQCCAGKFLANTGTIAHHGYTRPGYGWQTASCIGAKYLPFEVERTQLGKLINVLRTHKKGMVSARSDINNETVAISVIFRDNSRPKVRGLGGYMEYPNITVDVTRENFDAVVSENLKNGIRIYGEFTDLKREELGRRDRVIKSITDDINACVARFNGWKQTHTWNAAKKEWRGL